MYTTLDVKALILTTTAAAAAAATKKLSESVKSLDVFFKDKLEFLP